MYEQIISFRIGENARDRKNFHLTDNTFRIQLDVDTDYKGGDTMANIPVIKLGIVAVSRDCFPIKLSRVRRAALVAAYQQKYGQIIEVENHYRE